MNRKIPPILSEVLGAAEKTLAKPTGDDRRQAALDALKGLVHQAAEWGTDEPRRYVNEWTLLLMTMLCRLERLGPFGNKDDIARARAVAETLMPFVKIDAGCALEVLGRQHLADAPARGGRG